jgi:hypothetical protein
MFRYGIMGAGKKDFPAQTMGDIMAALSISWRHYL